MSFREESHRRALDIGLGRVPLAEAAQGVRAELVALRIRCSGLGHFLRRREIDRLIDTLDRLESDATRVG